MVVRLLKLLAVSLLATISIFGTMILVYLVSKSIALSLVLSMLPLYPIVWFLPKVFPSEIEKFRQKVNNEKSCESTPKADNTT